MTPGCVPFLRVADARRSVGLYCERLGFRKNWEHQLASGYPLVVSLSRGAATVFLTEHPECTAGALVYFYVADVDDLAGELGATGITVEWGPIDQPWGLREIQVQDLDGNRLRFGAEIERSA